jgi:hypothetical protein
MACKSCQVVLNKALVVGILSVSFCILVGIPFCQASHASDALNSYKELQSNFIGEKNKFSQVRPGPTLLPPSGRILPSHFDKMPSYRPSNEEITMTGSDSKEQVEDIEAINTFKQRTIVYDDVQRGNGVNKSNSMNIEVTGKGQEKKSVMDSKDDFGNTIEEKVDSAIASGMSHGSGDRTDSIRTQVNDLNIDVNGISVSAINTVQGGTAIATSNIKIEPVQIIVAPSEASEKLK